MTNQLLHTVFRHSVPLIKTCLFAMLLVAVILVSMSLFGTASVGMSASDRALPIPTKNKVTPSKIVLPPPEKAPKPGEKTKKENKPEANKGTKKPGPTGSTTNMYAVASSTVNPHPFKFLLNEEDVCSRKRTDLFIISVIHTAPKNYKRRMLIRETWGSQRLYHQVKTVVIFAMGATGDPKIQRSVRLESERYRDIIQEDFLDSYRNLTYKGIMWLRWVSTYCPQAEFVLKVDDDIFVNIFNLVSHLQQLHSRKAISSRTILCLVWYSMPVLRDPKNKWYVPEADYANKMFSTYCSGSAYIISKELIKPMYEVSFRIKFFWVDDFYITGLLPKSLGVEYKSISSLYVLKHQELHDRLVGSYAIFGHIPGSLTKRYALWKEILEMRGTKPW